MTSYNPSLPLIDLHRHLDGNIRPKTIWALAQQHNIELPCQQFDDFLPQVQIQESEPDLMAFLAKLDWGVKVLTTLDDVNRIAYENVEDAKNAGIDYAELRFSPYYMAMSHNLNPSDVVAAVIDGVQAGEKAFGVKTNLIGILSRTFGIDACTTECQAILDHADKICALDLAGDELNFPAEQFKGLFKQAKDKGLQITVHAGEAAGAESIWSAIKNLGAQRIGHGVNAIQDPYLLDHLVRYNIGIESCLTSNYQTGTVTQIDKHPLSQFLQHGILACLNTDDPAVSNIELKHEFDVAKQVLKLTDEQITQLQLNAIDMAFLSDQEKQALRGKT